MTDYLFYILFIIILYFYASIIEWYWHKNILHSKNYKLYQWDKCNIDLCFIVAILFIIILLLIRTIFYF